MIKKLVMMKVIGDLLRGWGAKEGQYLCAKGVREFFDVPEETKEIVFNVSNKPVRGATKARVIPHPAELSCFLDACKVIKFDNNGEITKGLEACFEKWLPTGDFWFWIEY